MANPHSTACDIQQDDQDGGLAAEDETSWVFLETATEPSKQLGDNSGAPAESGNHQGLERSSSSSAMEIVTSNIADTDLPCRQQLQASLAPSAEKPCEDKECGAVQQDDPQPCPSVCEADEAPSRADCVADAWIIEPTEPSGEQEKHSGEQQECGEAQCDDLQPSAGSAEVDRADAQADCAKEEDCAGVPLCVPSSHPADLNSHPECVDDEHLTLDEPTFRHFAPLLKASQAYAALSGCRFRSNSFDGLRDAVDTRTDLPTISSTRSRDAGPRLAAKLTAAPTVRDFTSRLLANEPALVEELERAHRIVMSESVRNSMISTCQEYSMFPPSPPPDGVEDEDCAYQDTSAPFPTIAQRLYNDQVHRLCSAGDDKEPQARRLQKRAMTAAFIIDFAQDAGVVLPSMPEAYDAMISEFSLRTAAWAESTRRGQATGLGNLSTCRSEILKEGSAAAERWFPELSVQKHKHPVLFAAGAVALGAAAVASTSLGWKVRSS